MVLFIRYWRVLLVSCGILFIWQQQLHIEYLKHQLTQEKIENTSIITANNLLTASIQTQNSAITDLQVKKQQASKKAASALAKAQKQMQHYKKVVTDIKSQKITANECSDLTQLINKYVP